MPTVMSRAGRRWSCGAMPRSLCAIGLTLGAEHIALHAGLLFEDAALIAPVALGRRRVLRAGRWRIGRWLVCHGRYLAPFLVVLARFVVLSCGDDGGRSDRWRRWRRCGGARISRGHRGGVVGRAFKEGHQTGDDDEERPAVAPAEDVEAGEQEHDSDEDDPDGAAKRAEEANR